MATIIRCDVPGCKNEMDRDHDITVEITLTGVMHADPHMDGVERITAASHARIPDEDRQQFPQITSDHFVYSLCDTHKQAFYDLVSEDLKNLGL